MDVRGFFGEIGIKLQVLKGASCKKRERERSFLGSDFVFVGGVYKTRLKSSQKKEKY